jgi:hypothetical protein
VLPLWATLVSHTSKSLKSSIIYIYHAGGKYWGFIEYFYDGSRSVTVEESLRSFFTYNGSYTYYNYSKSYTKGGTMCRFINIVSWDMGADKLQVVKFPNTTLKGIREIVRLGV